MSEKFALVKSEKTPASRIETILANPDAAVAPIRQAIDGYIEATHSMSDKDYVIARKKLEGSTQTYKVMLDYVKNESLELAKIIGQEGLEKFAGSERFAPALEESFKRFMHTYDVIYDTMRIKSARVRRMHNTEALAEIVKLATWEADPNQNPNNEISEEALAYVAKIDTAYEKLRRFGINDPEMLGAVQEAEYVFTQADAWFSKLGFTDPHLSAKDKSIRAPSVFERDAWRAMTEEWMENRAMLKWTLDSIKGLQDSMYALKVHRDRVAKTAVIVRPLLSAAEMATKVRGDITRNLHILDESAEAETSWKLAGHVQEAREKLVKLDAAWEKIASFSTLLTLKIEAEAKTAKPLE